MEHTHTFTFLLSSSVLALGGCGTTVLGGGTSGGSSSSGTSGNGETTGASVGATGGPTGTTGGAFGAGGAASASVAVGTGGAVSASAAVGAGGATGACGSVGGGAIPGDVACWQSTVTVGTTPAPVPAGFATMDGGLTPAPCSLVGTWDVLPSTAYFATLPAYYSFDASGRFISGAPGADPCSGYDFAGNYVACGSVIWMSNFQGTRSFPDGCAYFNGARAGYSPQFSADCSELTVQVTADNCTGSGVFRDGGILKRRP
jgi:hypothetical protein